MSLVAPSPERVVFTDYRLALKNLYEGRRAATIEVASIKRKHRYNVPIVRDRSRWLTVILLII